MIPQGDGGNAVGGLVHFESDVAVLWFSPLERRRRRRPSWKHRLHENQQEPNSGGICDPIAL